MDTLTTPSASPARSTDMTIETLISPTNPTAECVVVITLGGKISVYREDVQGEMLLSGATNRLAVSAYLASEGYTLP